MPYWILRFGIAASVVAGSVLAAVAVPLALLWWLRSRGQGGVDYVSQFWFVNPYQPELGRIGALGLVDRVLENGSKYIRIHLPILLAGSSGVLPLLTALARDVTGICDSVMLKTCR